MKILSIDTASNLCTVAVLENKKCIKEIENLTAMNVDEVQILAKGICKPGEEEE